MSIYAIVAFALCVACGYFGTKKLRNRRVGLRAPLPHCTDTKEYHYMRTLR